MKTAKPLVSIVVTVFNKEAYLPLVVDSYNNQTTCFPLELIFVDDASTDHSVSILSSMGKQQNNLQIIHNNENAGPAVRLNQGLAHANGEYIMMVDGDDVLSRSAIETLVSLMQTYNADMVYGSYGGRVCENKKNLQIPEFSIQPRHRVIQKPLEHIILNRQIGMGVMINRKLLERFGGCDEQVFAQDISLQLKLGKSSRCMVIVNEPYMFGFVDNNNSFSFSNEAQGLHDRALSNLNFLLENGAMLTPKLIKAMINTCISATWKYHSRRDSISKSELSKYLLIYLQSKLGIYNDPISLMRKAVESFDNNTTIRRINSTSHATPKTVS